LDAVVIAFVSFFICVNKRWLLASDAKIFLLLGIKTAPGDIYSVGLKYEFFLFKPK
jgi:hypothetical protein